MARFNSIIRFDNVKVRPGIKIPSPVSGSVYPVDDLFFQKIGHGVQIRVEGHAIASPINGTVIDLVEGLGKVIIQAKNGIRFLLQLSFELLKNHGLGIAPRVRVGQHVKVQTILFDVDLYKLQSQLKPCLLYVVLLDSKSFKAIDVPHKHVTMGQDTLLSLIPIDKKK